MFLSTAVMVLVDNRSQLLCWETMDMTFENILVVDINVDESPCTAGLSDAHAMPRYVTVISTTLQKARRQ